jgi:hypothetical protein
VVASGLVFLLLVSSLRSFFTQARFFSPAQ